MKKLSVFLLLAIIFAAGCTGENIEEFDGESFAQNVRDDIAAGKESAEYFFSGAMENYTDSIDSIVQSLLYDEFFCGYFTDTIDITYENSFGSFSCVLEYSYNDNAARINDYRQGAAAIEHDKEKLESILEASLAQGEKNIHLLFLAEDGLSWESVEEEFTGIYKNNEYFTYLTDTVSYAAYEYEDYIAFDLTAEYTKDTAPVFDAAGYDVMQLAFYFEETFSTWDEKAAVRTEGLTDDDIILAFQIAAANDSADISCEIQQVFTNKAEGENGMITELAAIMPADAETRTVCTAEMKEAIASAADTVIKSGVSDTEDVLEEIAGIVCEKTEYSEELKDISLKTEEDRTAETAISRTAYGALVEGETVCSGYAGAVKALCDALGIPCRVVCGEADGVGHAWNAVYLNGETLYIDTTYMDTGGGDAYFLFTKDDYERDDRTEMEGWVLPW